MNIEQAARHSRNGAIAAFISGGVTLLLVIFAMTSDADGTFAIWNDPANFVDVVLIFLCAAGMLRNSRAAAVTIFIYFIFAKIYIAIETGETTGAAAGLVFLYFFARAIQGSFTYHKLRKAEDPGYKPASKWMYYLGIPVITLFFLLVGIGLLTMTDIVPSTEVLAGADVSERDHRLLTEAGILYDGEEIEFLYSYGIISVVEGGSILSNRAVITYFTDEVGAVQAYEVPLFDVVGIELIEVGDFWNDSVYRVDSAAEDGWITISLSTENGGDLKFVDAVRERMGKGAPEAVPE